VLVLANNDSDLTGAPAVQKFVDRVAEVSRGTVTVKVVSSWKGGGGEVRVLRSVTTGEAALGWVGTRALDQIGFTTLTPINAPFLVGSYPAQASVVSDTTVEHQLAGLEAKGLTGLTLLADELRFPVGIAHPFLSLKDYSGARIRTNTSGIQSAGISALGATPTDVPIHPDTQPPLSGFETMWWTYEENTYAGFAKFPTINTPLWPRTVVLVGNPSSLSKLGEKQRSWIDQAATDARTWSVQHASDPVQHEIDQACDRGAKIASATPAQQAALKSAVAPIYNQLATAVGTAAVFRRVSDLASAAPTDPVPTLPSGCAFTTADLHSVRKQPVKLAAPGHDGSFPTGIFRITSTYDDLIALGSSDYDARLNAGTYTYTLRDGRWHYDQKPDYPEGTQTFCGGFYDVTGSSIMFSTTTVLAVGDCSPPVWVSHWSFAGTTLSWSGAVADDMGFAHAWDTTRWTKIG
jgi:TRAP-type C4-dicarboxylate transport system substrate-binding protein